VEETASLFCQKRRGKTATSKERKCLRLLYMVKGGVGWVGVEERGRWATVTGS
jgi:hypothetical protein